MKLRLSNCFLAFFSSVFQAFGMYHIHSISQITEGGVLGLTLLLDHWFSISPAISGFLLTGLCFLLGWKTMGKSFILYSLIAAAGFSSGYAFFQQFPRLFPQIAAYPLAASIAGGLFIRIGAGLCVRAGGATTGDDALAMSLSRITGWDIQWIYLITDLSVLLLSLTYIPVQKILYSLLTVILSGQIIGWIQKIPIKSKKCA